MFFSNWTSIAIGLLSIGLFILLANPKAHFANNLLRLILTWGGCMLLTALWHYQLINRIISGRAADSFYQLNGFQQLGLIAWSALLIVALFWISTFKSNKIYAHYVLHRKKSLIGLIVDLLTTFILFVILYLISPQVYYFYYQLVIPGLPVQWILRPELDLKSLLPKLLLLSTTNYSDLLSGFTIWVLMFGTSLKYLATWLRQQRRIWAALVGIGLGLIHYGLRY